MRKHNKQLTPLIETDFDSCCRAGRSTRRQAIPALPDPVTGIVPGPANLGNSRLKPPVSR